MASSCDCLLCTQEISKQDHQACRRQDQPDESRPEPVQALGDVPLLQEMQVGCKVRHWETLLRCGASSPHSLHAWHTALQRNVVPPELLVLCKQQRTMSQLPAGITLLQHSPQTFCTEGASEPSHAKGMRATPQSECLLHKNCAGEYNPQQSTYRHHEPQGWVR